MKNEYLVVGGMAGSSMDGLDLAMAVFLYEDQNWRFKIKKCQTFEYPEGLFRKLQHAPKTDLTEKKELDAAFGSWVAHQARSFLGPDTVDLMAIHGHTVEHNPEKGVSWQLGSGKRIAQETGILTITEFRTEDVLLGGQGAPLVPLGDFLLFNEYDACLNLGGIANVSIKESRLAGDVCPCNQVLNYYASQLGHEYDESGNMAREGHLHHGFLAKLNTFSYFKSPFPKSLPNQFLDEALLKSISPLDGLRSYTEFISEQIAKALNPINKKCKLLITGGGAFNTFLIELLEERLPNWDIQVPDETTISYKEAVIFGFLGLKKYLGEINVLCSVTGALHDTSSGVIHLPK